MTANIKPITSPGDMRKLEDIQRETWGMRDIDIIPARTMHAIAFNGGLLLGAYSGEEERETLVGFIFGVIGTLESLSNRIDPVAAARLQLYSTIMGVAPAYQGQGIGTQLKLAQREYALRLGIRLVTWTYDPLLSRNAWFNIGRLGAICHTYLPDFHGELTGINAGVATDRFYVEWWVTGNRVQSRVNRRRRPLSYEQLIAGRARLINEVHFGEHGLPLAPPAFAEEESNLVLVEIPADYAELKAHDMAAAIAWRAHTKELFEHYFAHQYIVTDFARRTDEDGRERAYYVLTYQHA
jgi:chorismate synthase